MAGRGEAFRRLLQRAADDQNSCSDEQNASDARASRSLEESTSRSSDEPRPIGRAQRLAMARARQIDQDPGVFSGTEMSKTSSSDGIQKKDLSPVSFWLICRLFLIFLYVTGTCTWSWCFIGSQIATKTAGKLCIHERD